MNIDFTNAVTYGSYLDKMVDPNKFYASASQGSTAIGGLWEKLNGVETNNRTDCDINGLELKAKRDKSKQCRLTLFTSNPVTICSTGGPVVGKLVTEFGKPHRHRPDDLSLHKTMTMGRVKMPNGYVVELAQDAAGLVLHNGVGELARWPMSSLETGANKIETMSLAYAQSETFNNIEHFRYHTVYHYHGLGIDGLMRGLEEKKVVVEFRASFKDGVLRDRGTAFRISPKWLDTFYEDVRIIWQKNIAK